MHALCCACSRPLLAHSVSGAGPRPHGWNLWNYGQWFQGGRGATASSPRTQRDISHQYAQGRAVECEIRSDPSKRKFSHRACEGVHRSMVCDATSAESAASLRSHRAGNSIRLPDGASPCGGGSAAMSLSVRTSRVPVIADGVTVFDPRSPQG